MLSFQLTLCNEKKGTKSCRLSLADFHAKKKNIVIGKLFPNVQHKRETRKQMFYGPNNEKKKRQQTVHRLNGITIHGQFDEFFVLQ